MSASSIWESGSVTYLVHGRPSLDSLHYSTFVNEGFHFNNCVIDDEYVDAADITHRLLSPVVIAIDIIRHAGGFFWTLFSVRPELVMRNF